MNETTITVKGMTCGGCVQSVENGLSRLPGVSEVRVDLASGHVKIRHESPVIDRAVIAAAVDQLGFDLA